MKIRVALLSAALIAATVVLASAAKTPAKTPSKASFGGVSASGADIGFHTDLATNQIDRFAITGRAHIESVDQATQTTFSADAAKITVQFLTGKPKAGAAGMSLVKSGDFAGPVKMVYTVKTNGVTTKTVATADAGTYSGKDQMACLTGNVKITSEDPSKFESPAVLTGDKATINLSPTMGPDDYRFRVESSPGVSTIVVTPKAKEDQ